MTRQKDRSDQFDAAAGRLPARPTQAAPQASAQPSKQASPFGHPFANPALLELALTHRSAAHERRPEFHGSPDNEQLEFLGDAVLGLLVADALYRRFPASSEGELTRMRASLISRKHLGGVGERLGIAAMLRLGPGLERGGGRSKPALISNALEAILGAIYLDGGLDPARAFVDRHIIQPSLDHLNLALEEKAAFSGVIGDYKSALQERLQASGTDLPEYVLIGETGPAHNRVFEVEVRLVPSTGGVARVLAHSEASTKKQAQQQAARLALARLVAETPDVPKESNHHVANA